MTRSGLMRLPSASIGGSGEGDQSELELELPGEVILKLIKVLELAACFPKGNLPSFSLMYWR